MTRQVIDPIKVGRSKRILQKMGWGQFLLIRLSESISSISGKAAIAAYRFVDLLERKYEMFYGKMERFTTLPLVARV